MKYKAYAIRGHEIVSTLEMPSDINADNREEWVNQVKSFGLYDEVIFINEQDFVRLFW